MAVTKERSYAMWVILVLLSSVIMAVNSIIDKRLMSGGTAHPLICAASFGMVGCPVAIAGLVLLPPAPLSTILMGTFAGMLFVGAAWLYYISVACDEISRVAPLLRLSTVQMLIFEIFFMNVMLEVHQWVAFAILLASSLLLVVKPDGKVFTFSRAVQPILPATTLLAIHGIMMAHIYRTVSVWAGVVYENLGMVIAAGIALCAFQIHSRGSVSTPTPKTWVILISGQALRLVTGLAPAWAIASGVSASLISVLTGIRPAWIWLLAILVLGERFTRQDFLLKGAGILGMILGVLWLT